MQTGARARTARRFIRSIAAVIVSSTILAACASAPPSPPPAAADRDREISRIVDAAETMFKSMKARDYRETWASLSAKSRDTLVRETREALLRSGEGGSPADADAARIAADFRDGGPVATAFWEAYLTHFDPDTALSASRWEMGGIANDRAAIRITYKTSERPAVLEMFLEEGRWKVGLVETFWGRK